MMLARLIGLLCILVLIRYRAMVAFMYSLLLLEHLSRKLILFFMPIPRTGNPPGAFINLEPVVGAVLGVWLAIQGKINIGDIQAFIQYMSSFTQPIMQTANIANVLQSTAAAAPAVIPIHRRAAQIQSAATGSLPPYRSARWQPTYTRG